MFGMEVGRFIRSDDDDRTPVGINVAVGAVTVAVATFLAARLPGVAAEGRCAVVAVALGAFAACAVDLAAVVLLLAPTWMIMNGFLVNRSGNLSWHGSADLYRLLVLIGVGTLGLAAGETTGRVRDLQERWRLGAVAEAMSIEFDEEKHRA